MSRENERFSFISGNSVSVVCENEEVEVKEEAADLDLR